MTFKEKGIELLVNKGMFESQATQVMDIIIEDSKTNSQSPNKSMKDRWDDDTSGYPFPMIAILGVAIKPFALKWIDENLPLAWYRPMFLN